MNTKRLEGLRMNLKRLAVILLPGLLLAGCFDPGSSKTQGSSASVTIDIPALAKSHDGISPAFIDHSTTNLLLQVRRSVIGGYDEAPQALVEWYQCLLGYDPAATDFSGFYELLPSRITELLGKSLSGIEVIHPACGLYPAGHDGHPVVDEKVISSTTPSVRFDLEPGKYRFTVTQRSSADGDIAITTAYATLNPGSNELVIQLMYGDWQFDQPLTASLLGGFEDPDHAINMRLASLLEDLSNIDPQIDPQNELIAFLRDVGGYWGDTNSPAAVWGVIDENEPLTLKGVQLTGGRTASALNDPLADWGRYDVLERYQADEAYFTPDSGSSQEPVIWLQNILSGLFSESAFSSLCSDFYCFLDSYGKAAVSAQGTEWHFTGDESLGMGWFEVSDNGITRTGQTGIASPALLMQQYKQRKNSHRISLGEIAFSENNGRGFEQKAGLYFYGLEPQPASLGNLVADQQKSAWQITNAEASVTGDDALSLYFNLSHLTVKVLGAAFPDLKPTTLDDNKINALVVEYIQYSTNSTEYRELPIDEVAPLLASIPDPLPEDSYSFLVDVPVDKLGLLAMHQVGVTQRINRVLDQLYQQQQTGSLPSSSASPGCFVLYEQQFPTFLEVNKTGGGTWQPSSTTFDTAESVPTALWVCVHRAGLTAQNL